MSDCQERFLVMIENVTKDDVDWANKLLDDSIDNDDDNIPEVQFIKARTKTSNTGSMKIDENSGFDGPREAANFISRWLKARRPDAVVRLEWATTTSPAQVDGFGGGAIRITAESVTYFGTGDIYEAMGQGLARKLALADALLATDKILAMSEANFARFLSAVKDGHVPATVAGIYDNKGKEKKR